MSTRLSIDDSIAVHRTLAVCREQISQHKAADDWPACEEREEQWTAAYRALWNCVKQT